VALHIAKRNRLWCHSMNDETPPHPTLYDVAIHGERLATQDDVDRLMRLGAEWVKCRDALRKALDDMQAAIIAPL
jgi:hypothetical protein